MAALKAVQLPFKTPVIEVERVIAGVVVALATLHANPLADTTLAVVTVPQAEGAVYLTPLACAESATSIYPSVPTGRRA